MFRFRSPDSSVRARVSGPDRSSLADHGLGRSVLRFLPTLGLSAALLAGCAGGPAPVAGGPASSDASFEVQPTPSGAETATAAAPPSGAAAAPSTALIWVNGMGCPLCSNNVEKQLKAVPGVESVAINLGTGIVSARLDPARQPTQAQLEKAVANSGFTLVHIQMP